MIKNSINCMYSGPISYFLSNTQLSSLLVKFLSYFVIFPPSSSFILFILSFFCSIHVFPHLLLLCYMLNFIMLYVELYYL